MVLLYACTIFFSAFLLFQVQPIIGKMILPWFGGSAAVWSSCMLFFQGLLLLGYLYAHLTTRYLSPKKQAVLHIFLLGLSVLLLPITPNETWKPDGSGDPTVLIIGLMTASIGLPYFLLSSTGPLVQAWFAREKPGSVPYRLFALSNFGSMLGLLSYPIIFEPWFAVPRMSIGWSSAYAAFSLICAALASRGFRAQRILEFNAKFPKPVRIAPTRKNRLQWLALSALPTVLLMSITSHLTQNIAPVPLLWVLPLALYLVSFILCFEGGNWYRRTIYLPCFIILAAVMIVFIAFPHLTSSGIGWPVAIFCSGLFVCCMVSHGELAKLKPHSSYLTSFYLIIAAGGAIGGTFVAVLAPRVFNDDYELLIAIFLTVIIVFRIIYIEPNIEKPQLWHKESWSKAIVFNVVLLSILVLARFSMLDRQDIKLRNFYGTIKAKQSGTDDKAVKRLAHGIIMHGFQHMDPAKKRWPTAYYNENSGVGLGLIASRTEGSQRVGVIGLGVGTMAAYCRKGDYYRFFEINPLITKLAKTEFTFLSDCPATVEIKHGDARLSLEQENPHNFDLLVLDAFSGDSVPVHLLTREAFGVYFRHLKESGILAVHVSNRNLDLIPVVKNGANFYKKEAFLVNSKTANVVNDGGSEWVLVGNWSKVAQFEQIRVMGQELKHATDLRPWTDDYSSIYRILK